MKKAMLTMKQMNNMKKNAKHAASLRYSFEGAQSEFLIKFTQHIWFCF